MSAFMPFQPSVVSGVAGKTVSLAVGAGAATSQATQILSSLGQQPSILVTFAGATAGTVAYLRMSVESSTTITATATDTPIVASTNVPTVRLFANPGAIGTCNIAVVVTATPATAGTIWFTPGIGGT